MSEKNQLSKNDHLKLSEQCREKNIEYMCTAFDLESLIFLHETLNVSRFKIPSGEIFSLDLLEYICNIDKPILLSTGLAKMEDINKEFLFPLLAKESLDILIIGTGESTVFLLPKQQVELSELGLGIECMNNTSASSSFNLLLADLRKVGLLII